MGFELGVVKETRDEGGYCTPSGRLLALSRGGSGSDNEAMRTRSFRVTLLAIATFGLVACGGKYPPGAFPPTTASKPVGQATPAPATGALAVELPDAQTASPTATLPPDN